MQITLNRFCNCEMGVFGIMEIPGKPRLYTVERPWRNNERNVSCVPALPYRLLLRPSPLTTRITRGRYTHAWELQEVQGRSHILVHPANAASELEGCIAPGLDLGFVHNAWAVTRSRDAFDVFMGSLAVDEENEILISWMGDPEVRDA